MRHRLLAFSLGFLVLITVCTRFYHLDWGAPYFFNPDERNIATSVTQLAFPSQLNPHFFAYGSLPLYSIYFIGMLYNFFARIKPIHILSFSEAIMISRLFSAFFSAIIPILLYRLGKQFIDERTGFVAAFLGTCSVGLTQYAHFGTFELWLTIETLVFFVVLTRVIKHTTVRSVLLQSIISGILIGTKISTLPLVSFGFFSIIWGAKILHTNWHLPKREVAKQGLLFVILFTITTVLLYLATNPYALIDMKSFLGSITYEKNVATGIDHVFYTDTFQGTIPGLYQLTHVLPFLLSPLLSILWIPALCYSLFVIPEKKRKLYLLFAGIFLVTLVPQLFLYVKWTRYMVPTLPFIYMFVAVCFTQIFKEKRGALTLHLWSFITGIVCISLILAWGAFIYTVYTKPDTRMQAATWAKNHVSPQTPITSEPYDLGLLPFNEILPNIHMINFYSLEQMDAKTTLSQVQTSGAILLPSTRISRTRIAHPELYPSGAKFYNELVSEKIGFTTAYRSPCDYLCTIAYFGKPEGWYEETAYIFDRPTVTILMRNEF